jgi:methyl-accepting chemotaxis protein
MHDQQPSKEDHLQKRPEPSQGTETPEARATGKTPAKKRKIMTKQAAAPGQSGVNDKGLKELKRIVSALQAGRLQERADAASFSGEWAEAFETINAFAGSVNGLIGDMNAMSSAHDNGDIDIAIDSGKYTGDFAGMASGINTMVAGHISVKKKAMACVAEIANGNFEAPLEKFPGKKIFINETIETLRGNLKSVIAGMNAMSAEHDKGEIDFMIDAGKFPGDFGRMASGINTMVAGHIAVKKKAMACVAEFGNGNFEAQLEKFPGKKAFINDTIETLRNNLQAIVGEIQRLTQASSAGMLDERGKAGQFKGDFAGMVSGINQMLDAILLPIAEGNRVLRLIRGGNLREKVEIDCHGDHQRMKDAVNGVHSWLNALVAYVTALANGDLTAHMDKASEQDQIHEWLMLLKNNIGALVTDANMLSVAAVEGKLATRADASKHRGDFRKIVQGVNDTLNAVIGPLNVAATYVDQIAKGAIPAKITDSYNGDFNTIKNNLNTCIDAVNALVGDANVLAKAAVEGKLATRADASKHQGDFRKIVEGVNGTLDAVIGPLNVAANYVDQIAKGDIPAKITDSYNGDFNVLKNNLNACIEAINQQAAAAQSIAMGDLTARINVRSENDAVAKSLVRVSEVLGALQRELARLTDASKEGQLSERGKADQFQGAYAEVLRGVNVMLDAILIPIGEGNRVLRLIRGGNLRERVEIACKGDHEQMKQAINGVHGWLEALIAYVKGVANGNLTVHMDKASQDDQIHEWLMLLKNNISSLVGDANMLAKAAVEGKLATRADATKHQGDYRRIVEGVNNTLDAVIGPLNVAATYVDQISKGAIPSKITDNYNGDFNAIKNNLNTCIDAVNSLVADANMLSKAAVEGKLATRADASKHQGDFRKIVQGVNDTLDAVIGPLNVAATYVDQISKGAIPAKITDSYNGDFNAIKNNLNTCIDAVNALVGDANMLSAAAVEGKLATRADASKHQGDFRKIVQGVNETLDAVITPLNNIKQVVDGLGRNDMSVAFSGEYRGDFLALKDAFERALGEVNGTLHQIVDAVEQVGQSAEELKAASQNMASTSEEQSSSVEEVTSSLEQTDTQVKANTDAANTANQLVMSTSQAANAGQTKMSAMTSAMSEINASAQNIAKIIKVIDEIAFQTNLLALNAAVEAARAGQHGRGFAVVAQEVRNLAGRSAKAARETAELIENSVKQVAGGVGIAKETSEALDQIVGNVVKVKDLVGEIATASAEQARGVSQINVAMNQVAKAAQEGSQQSEELAASSGELASLADRMRESVRRFKLRERARGGQSVADLDGFSPEVLAQFQAMMAQKRASSTTAAPSRQAPAAKRTANGVNGKSPKAVIPLDHDERGFGEF